MPCTHFRTSRSTRSRRRPAFQFVNPPVLYVAAGGIVAGHGRVRPPHASFGLPRSCPVGRGEGAFWRQFFFIFLEQRPNGGPTSSPTTASRNWRAGDARSYANSSFRRSSRWTRLIVSRSSGFRDGRGSNLLLDDADIGVSIPPMSFPNPSLCPAIPPGPATSGSYGSPQKWKSAAIALDPKPIINSMGGHSRPALCFFTDPPYNV